MNTKRILLSAAFLAVAAVAAQAQDKIIWKGDRAPTDGTVVSINFTQIKYRLPGAGSEQEDLAKDVRDIEFDSENNTALPYYEFDQGNKALHKGLFKESVQQFERALDRLKQSNTPNHPMRDFCRKHIIEAHLGNGDAEAVLKACRDLRKEKPDSFFLRDSFLMQYDAAKMKRDTALQEATIKDIDEAIRSDRKYQDLQRDADLLRADMMESSKRHRDALQVYNRLSSDRELWEEVSLGMLRCLNALGETANLKAKVESLLTEIKEKRDSNPRVFLGAIIARGDVSLAENKIKEALLDYMKGALDPGQAANSFEHETAIAKAAMASARYAKQFGEKDKANKVLYLDRARELKDELKRTFPQTTWTTEVDAAINDAARSQ